MADITMCFNKDCAVRTSCYRAMAYENPHRQSYAFFEPDEFGKCADMIPIRKVSLAEQPSK